MRRTLGGDVESFDLSYTDSINSSVLEVLLKYFKFPSQIILGIDGNFFTLIVFIPIMIFIWNAYHSKLSKNDLFLYILSFITTISWHVLGKAHSFIHTHMNFVLWYFVFIPVCFYIILKQLNGWVKNKEYSNEVNEKQ
jgi:hypothetical protein